jgi:hypothetical protein
MPAPQAVTQTGSDTLATSTPASAIGPTRPWFRNTHLVRGAIASNRARVVVLGDSLMNITTPSGGYKSGATMLMQVGAFGHIRAFQAGGGDVGNMPVRISPVSPGASGVLIGLHHDTAKSVTAAPDAPEYVGLPVHCNGMRIDAPSWSPPSGVLATVTLSLPWLAEAVHPAWSPADAQGVGCRLLQYTPAGASVVDAACTVRDGQWYGTARAVCNPADGLLGNPPIAGQINPVAPDVLLTADAGGGAKSAVVVASQPVGSAGYLLLVDPVFYHANDNGAGAPARVPGNYVQVLARLSWARWNFSRDTVPTATFTKSDTDARYNRFFQITTLDAGHQPVIVVRVDTEYSETPGGFPELGPTATMCTRADYRAALEALMARMDDVFATIPGSPAPIYWFQQPVHHWSGLPGFGAGPASSKNDAINADRHNRLLEAMHDVCAVPGSRAAYTSLFAFFQARLPHPNPTVDPVVRSVLDSAFGANWVPPGTSYAPYTPGTGGDGGALLDSLGIHTKNAGAERIMAWICKHSVDVDPSPCPGDANGDGVTNSQDFVVFALAYGRPAGAASARLDFNTDGVVDAQDLRPLVDDLGCGE